MNVSKTSILDQNKREMEKPCLVLKNSLQILCQLPFLHRLHILSIIEVNAFSVDKRSHSRRACSICTTNNRDALDLDV
jgi:hypothetical protein